MKSNALKLFATIALLTAVWFLPNVGGQSSCPHEEVIDIDPCSFCRNMVACTPTSTNDCFFGTANAWLNQVNPTYQYTQALDLGPVNIQCTQWKGKCNGTGTCVNWDYWQWCYRSYSQAYVQITCE